MGGPQLKPAGGVRADILSAAEQLILDNGLNAATTRAIAATAGCAEGSIYRQFPDKDALVIEVVRPASRSSRMTTRIAEIDQAIPQRVDTSGEAFRMKLHGAELADSLTKQRGAKNGRRTHTQRYCRRG